MKIVSLKAREIFDSRGMPTVEVDLWLEDGAWGRAAVPCGASTGEHEAVELRDGDNRLGGKGVRRAVVNIQTKIWDRLADREWDQLSLDEEMIRLDGTKNKSVLGANAILAVSMAFAKAAAAAEGVALWQYFRKLSKTAPREWIMPVPMMNVLNGGKHAEGTTDLQEYMIVPLGAKSFSQAMEMGVTVFGVLKKVLRGRGWPTTVGDEGGFAPTLGSNKEPLSLIGEAVESAGYRLGEEVAVALDCAASEFFDKDRGYKLREMAGYLTSGQMMEMYEEWLGEYPVVSIEDGLDQNDWEGHQEMTRRLGSRIQLVGDDLFVTNVERLRMGIDKGAGNAILIKPNQIGTVSETVAAVDLARDNGYATIVSHRSGETEDTTIADLAVGLGTGQIKVGSLSRSERMAKYNQLLRIEEALGEGARYLGKLRVG